MWDKTQRGQRFRMLSERPSWGHGDIYVRRVGQYLEGDGVGVGDIQILALIGRDTQGLRGHIADTGALRLA